MAPGSRWIRDAETSAGAEAGTSLRRFGGSGGRMPQGLQRFGGVDNCDCPPIDHHDALARALSWALKSRRERITGVQDQGWRDLLKILIKSELPEALEMARVLPLFRNCGGTLVTPDRQLFPLRVSPEFRVAVAPLSLELLSETDGSIVQFLSRLRVTEARAIVVKDDGLNSR